MAEHQHERTDYGIGLCCHCAKMGLYPAADGWVVCAQHRGL